MDGYVYKERTQGNLPHLHPPGPVLFVTFRLAESIPRFVLRQHQARKKWLQEETKRIAGLKLKDNSPEVQAHEQRLSEFRRQAFIKFEEILHLANIGPVWLKDERIARIVAEAMHRRDGQVFRLDAYCVMPNHVHVVFAPFLSEEELQELLLPEGLRFLSKNLPLDAIMQSLKGYTAYEANQALGRKGSFWEEESYDHVVRDDEEYARIVKYVLHNPVKAGLAKEWQGWPWNYRREDVQRAV